MSSGIYALRHKPSGKFYIGSTNDFTNRWYAWKSTMRRNVSGLPPAIRLTSIDPNDWELLPLHVCEATPSVLAKMEQLAIDAAVARAPDRVLNILPVWRADDGGLLVGDRRQTYAMWSRETGISGKTIASRVRAGWTPEQAVGFASPPDNDAVYRGRALAAMRVRIIGHDSQPLTLAETASILGCNRETLRERLQKYKRSQGIMSITLAELQASSLKYRRT